MERKNQEEIKYTHKVVMTAYSNGDDSMVSVKVDFEPDLSGEDIEDLGYLPAAFDFVEDYILPAIDEAYSEWAAGPLMKAESPSNRSH